MRLLPEPCRLLRFVFLSSINPEKRQIQAIHTCETKDDPLKLGLLSEIPLGNIFYSIKYDSKIYVGFDLSRLEKVIKNKFYFKRSFAITIVSRLRFEIIQTLIQVTLFPIFRRTKFSFTAAIQKNRYHAYTFLLAGKNSFVARILDQNHLNVSPFFPLYFFISLSGSKEFLL